MERKEINKKMEVLHKKVSELHHLESLLASIKKHQVNDGIEPDTNYVGNIERRIGTLKLQFDELLK